MKEIRRKNLRRICNEQFGGVVQAMADALGRQRSQVAGWLADPYQVQLQPRGISEEMGRNVIEPALGLARGELDIDPDAPRRTGANARVLLDTRQIKDPELRELIDRLILAALRRKVSARKLKSLVTLALEDEG